MEFVELTGSVNVPNNLSSEDMFMNLFTEEEPIIKNYSKLLKNLKNETIDINHLAQRLLIKLYETQHKYRQLQIEKSKIQDKYDELKNFMKKKDILNVYYAETNYCF